MNEYDAISVASGTIQMPQVTKAIWQLEKTVSELQASLMPLQGDVLTLRAQLAQEMVTQALLRTYVEYLNPAEGERPANPMSYADWIILQSVSQQIISARAAA